MSLLRKGVIPRRPLRGTDLRPSCLVMGTAALGPISRAAEIFDRFVDVGGTFFDTAHQYGYAYGPGCCERILGEWMRSRDLRNELFILGKGGHPPSTTPEVIDRELSESLDRLQCDHVELFMLHRDLTGVPIDEVVDLLCSITESGRARAYGFSNCSLDRLDAVAAYARIAGRPGPVALSNNLSLAVMETPIHPGCLSVSDRASRDRLAASGHTVIPWASQSRGVFSNVRDRDDFQGGMLAQCWFSEGNVERLIRARWMAERLGVLPINVALAWVLQQPFAVFPIIGPRSAEELDTSLPALDIRLSEREMAWLNLEEANIVETAG